MHTQKHQEKTATLSLAAVMAIRMLGLMMILPIFSLYSHQFTGATPTLIGLALGIYGLTQASLQIPFGMLSDRIGRKPIITAGLLILIAGSALCAIAHSIITVIIGRAMQGACAIGSTVLATLADLTSPQNRTKAMATLGVTIGIAFSAALFTGPLLSNLLGIRGIFWLTAGLALLAIAILYIWVPQPQNSHFHQDVQPLPKLLTATLKDKTLAQLNLGIFTIHAILVANFTALPLILKNTLYLPNHQLWHFYLPVLMAAFIAMIPFIILAEKYQKTKATLAGAAITIALAEFNLWGLHHTLYTIGLAMFLFFTAFTLLEALLPSLISKLTTPNSKGTAIGIYSTAQFAGIFFGGLAGGWIQHHYTPNHVFLFSTLFTLPWILLTATIQPTTNQINEDKTC